MVYFTVVVSLGKRLCHSGMHIVFKFVYVPGACHMNLIQLQ